MAGKDYSYLKKDLGELIVAKITPIGKKIEELRKDKRHLEAVLKKVLKKASIKAEENLKKIREIVGLV